jgi:hypothetical protein
MKVFVLILFIFSLLIAPVFVSADCNQPGTTVVFINGMFTFSENDAKKNKDLLEQDFKDIAKRADITFVTGYNPAHGGGLVDIVHVAIQGYLGGYLDYDLTNILRKAHEDVQTQKILLVGHSQGTFYTNAAYDYLVSHGVDKNSIAVYNVGTPADRVAGNGNYLTSSTDKVIEGVVAKLTAMADARRPLPPNIDLQLSAKEQADSLGGHSFSDVYLAEAPDRIIGDIDKEISSLQASNSNKSECFVQPPITTLYRVEDAGYAFADGLANNPQALATSPYSPEQMASLADALFGKIYNFGKSLALGFNKILADVGPGVFITSIMPGYSVQESASPVILTGDTVVSDNPSVSTDLPSYNGIGGPDTNPMTDAQKQDLLDDIQEKLDIISAEVQALIAQQNSNIQTPDTNSQNPEDLDRDNDNSDNNQDDNQNVITLPQNNSSGGGGGGQVNYPKILISEVQTAGTSDEKQEFVELYNPNDVEVDLTGWYLQKETSGGTVSYFDKKSLFSGLKISASGYFLIARVGYFVIPANVSVDSALSNDTELILKNPNDYISDKVGWGLAQDYETAPAVNPGKGQSLGRKVLADGTEQDTDNNLADFELQTPSPKTKNGQAQSDVGLSDITLPTITLSGASELTITVGDTYTDAGAKAADNIDGDITANIAIVNPVDANTIGNYTITYNVSDAAGNHAAEVSRLVHVIAAPVPLKNILINEIQIDSINGAGGTDDDWVELYNPNSVDVSLSGWSIQRYSKKDPCSVVKAPDSRKNFTSNEKKIFTIPANGFYLIVGTKANAELQAKADMLIGWSLTDNNTIYLVKNEDNIMGENDPDISDKVGFGATSCFPETAPAVNPPDGVSIERKIIGSDTDNNSNDFIISYEPTPGEASPKSFIQDATDYSNCTTTTYPGTTMYSLDIKWGSANPQTISYQVQYKLNDGQWQDWLADTSTTEKHFSSAYSLYNDKIYTFRARGKDGNGNFGSWQQVVVDLTNPVVINEVAFYGIGPMNVNYKQWIELYNRTSSPIVLDGWKIISDVHSLNIVLQGTIPANGYFTVERKQDSYVSNVSADQTFTGVFSPDDTILLKSKNNRQIDQFYSSQQPNWFSQGGNYHSLERISPYSFGQDEKNWYLSADPAFGTPSQQNSIYQKYTSNYLNSFVEDTTLKASLSPYLFQKATHIFPGVTVTVEPGVVIKTAESSLTVDGTLKAVGTPGQPIVFTSIDDTDYGGDIRFGGDTTAACAGQWAGIVFNSDSTGSDLENVVVRYGGSNNYGPGFGAGVRINGAATVSLINSTIDNNLNYGVGIYNSSPIIDSVQFSNQKLSDYSITPGEAIFTEGGSPQIKNSTFKGNYDSLYLTGTSQGSGHPVIENNDFENNHRIAYILGQDIYPYFSNNTMANNDYNAVIITESIHGDMGFQANLPYLIKADFTVPKDSTLTIDPGTIIKFADCGLSVYGTIKAGSLAGLPVVFTTQNDLDYGPDVRPSGDTTHALGGQWAGIIINQSSVNSDLENFVVRYGGGSLGVFVGAGLKIDQTPATLNKAIIQNNLTNGLWLVNSQSTIDSVQILDNKSFNGGPPVDGIYLDGGTTDIKNSYFADNDYGIFMMDMGDVPASPNLHSDPTDPEQNIFAPSANPFNPTTPFGPNIIQDIYNYSHP